jgi:hypothetical protein
MSDDKDRCRALSMRGDVPAPQAPIAQGESAMRGWLNRGRIWLLCATIGGVAVLEGCDASVRADVLTGVGSAATGLATTFIQAFFSGLISKQSDDTTAVQVFTEPALQIFS